MPNIPFQAKSSLSLSLILHQFPPRITIQEHLQPHKIRILLAEECHRLHLRKVYIPTTIRWKIRLH
jgi:hypothetical protein